MSITICRPSVADKAKKVEQIVGNNARWFDDFLPASALSTTAGPKHSARTSELLIDQRNICSWAAIIKLLSRHRYRRSRPSSVEIGFWVLYTSAEKLPGTDAQYNQQQNAQKVGLSECALRAGAHRCTTCGLHYCALSYSHAHGQPMPCVCACLHPDACSQGRNGSAQRSFGDIRCSDIKLLSGMQQLSKRHVMCKQVCNSVNKSPFP